MNSQILEHEMNTPGRRLKRLRESAKLTQRQLGKLADINDTHISLMENDQRTIGLSTGRRLAQALNASLADILDL